jgi:hypothetical protein
MATFVQNGDKVRITIGTSIYDYNLREVDYTHNGTTITVETDGYTRHNIAYLDVTSPSSTDIQDLVDQLNAYKVSISTTVDTSGLATEAKQDDAIQELQNVDETLKKLPKDYFQNLITVTPYNQVEVRFDAVDYADFITETTANGGSVSQSGGVVVVDSGSNIAGKSCLESVDNIEYRPGNQVYVSGTAVFNNGGIANNIRRVGLSTDVNTLDNSVTFGYEGTSFNIRYTSGGSEILNIAQSSWDDPCDGSANSKFTQNGLPVALDPTKGNVYRIIAGLLGFAGWVAEIFTPDGEWLQVYRYRHNNNVTTPVFESNSFKFIFFNENNGNTTPVTITSQCWNGGTNSTFDRINSTLNERTLAQTVRSVITGQTSSGGGGFVNVKVSPSGALEVNASQDTHDDLNANANLQVGDVDVSNANPIPVNVLNGAEGEVTDVELLRQLIVLTKFQTEQQIETNNLLKLILS